MRAASEFFLQVYMFYAQTNDTEYLKQYFDPESMSLNSLLVDWDEVRSWADGRGIYYLEDFKTRVATIEEQEVMQGNTGSDGTVQVFYEKDQKYQSIWFAMSISINPVTNKFWVYEIGLGREN